MSAGPLNRRGFTLIEVAVVSAVILLLMSGVYTVVAGGMRYLRLAQAHQTVNQQAVVGMRRVISEVSCASQSALQHADLPRDYLLFLSPLAPGPAASTDYTYNGTSLEWKKWVCFYLDDDNRLVRAELALPTPTTNPGGEAIPDFANDILPLPAQPVAHNVEEVDFSTPASGAVTVELRTFQETGSAKADGTKRETAMRLISSLRIVNL